METIRKSPDFRRRPLNQFSDMRNFLEQFVRTSGNVLLQPVETQCDCCQRLTSLIMKFPRNTPAFFLLAGKKHLGQAAQFLLVKINGFHELRVGDCTAQKISQ